MTTDQQNLLNNYFTAVLPFCNQQKVLELLARLGYQIEEPTALNCIKALEENGKEFSIPFGRIAEVAIASPKYEAYMKHLAMNNNHGIGKLVKANGTPLTNDQKINIANNVLGTVTSWLTTGKDIADTIVNKDANAAKAQAELLNAQALADAQNTQNTKSWVMPLAIGGGVLILAIVLIVVLGRKK